MDLALATGRGELLLTHWPEVGSPLVADEDAFQIGDREAELDGHGQLPPSIARLTVQSLLRMGIGPAVTEIAHRIRGRGLTRSWLHIDLDVLDRQVMPAVDTPGSPGLDFGHLAELVSGLVKTATVVGLDLTIYDPERDRRESYPAAIVECLAAGLAPLGVEDAMPAAMLGRA
jgi:arginase